MTSLTDEGRCSRFAGFAASWLFISWLTLTLAVDVLIAVGFAQALVTSSPTAVLAMCRSIGICVALAAPILGARLVWRLRGAANREEQLGDQLAVLLGIGTAGAFVALLFLALTVPPI